MGGLQGTGKSTFARILAPEFGAAPGAVVLRSDEIRKRLHGVMPEKRLPESAYSDQANAALNNVLVEEACSVAAGGHAVIVDATFLDPSLRLRLAASVQRAMLRFVGVWLYVPLPLLETRITARSADASDATVAILRRAAARDPGAMDWLPVDASDCSAALTAIRRAVVGHSALDE